jgi:hypothetical protein
MLQKLKLKDSILRCSFEQNSLKRFSIEELKEKPSFENISKAKRFFQRNHPEYYIKETNSFESFYESF